MEFIELKNCNLNNIYKLVIGNVSFIIRKSIFNNIFECEVLKLLECKDINSPRLKYNFISGGNFYMLYDYIEGVNPSIYDNYFFEKLIFQLLKVHKVDINLLKSENINVEDFNKLNIYYKNAINSKFISNDLSFIKNLYNEINIKLNFNELPVCLIHSDIKSENLLVDKDNVYLIDFGNCYIGNRIIDIIRIIMWFFIRYDNYNYDLIKYTIELYFHDNFLYEIEFKNIKLLFDYCLLYNLLKDISLCNDGLLSEDYVLNNSLKWLDFLKNKEETNKILEVFKNVKRFTK